MTTMSTNHATSTGLIHASCKQTTMGPDGTPITVPVHAGSVKILASDLEAGDFVWIGSCFERVEAVKVCNRRAVCHIAVTVPLSGTVKLVGDRLFHVVTDRDLS